MRSVPVLLGCLLQLADRLIAADSRYSINVLLLTDVEKDPRNYAMLVDGMAIQIPKLQMLPDEYFFK